MNPWKSVNPAATSQPNFSCVFNVDRARPFDPRNINIYQFKLQTSGLSGNMSFDVVIKSTVWTSYPRLANLKFGLFQT